MSKKRDSSAKRTIAGGLAGGVAGLAAAAALRKRRNVLLDTAASRSWLRRKLPKMPPAAAKKLKLRSDRLHSDADLLNEAAAQLPTTGVAGGAALGALSSSAREKKAEIIKEGRKMRMPKAFSKKMRKKLGFPKVGEEKAVMKSNQLAMPKTAGWFTAAKKTTKETASQAGARILKSNPELTKKPVANLSNARLQLQELKRQRALAAAASAKAYNPKVVTASMRSSHRIDQALTEIQRKFESLRKEEHTLPWRTDHGRYVEKTASTSDACALTAMMHTGTLEKSAFADTALILAASSPRSGRLAFTEAGHKQEAGMDKAEFKRVTKERNLSKNYSKKRPIFDMMQLGPVSRFGNKLDARHAEYSHKKHKKGKNPWNPMGGWLTPHSKESKKKAKTKKASVTWYEERLSTPSSVLGIEKEKDASAAYSLAGKFGPGAALGYSTGREAAGQSAAAVAPRGRKTRAEAIARKASVPLTIGGALAGVYAARGMPARRIYAKLLKLPKLSDAERKLIVEHALPAAAGMAGGTVTGIATGTAVGGAAHIKKASVTWYEERLSTPSSVLGIEKKAGLSSKLRPFRGAPEIKTLTGNPSGADVVGAFRALKKRGLTSAEIQRVAAHQQGRKAAKTLASSRKAPARRMGPNPRLERLFASMPLDVADASAGANRLTDYIPNFLREGQRGKLRTQAIAEAERGQLFRKGSRKGK